MIRNRSSKHPAGPQVRKNELAVSDLTALFFHATSILFSSGGGMAGQSGGKLTDGPLFLEW